MMNGIFSDAPIKKGETSQLIASNGPLPMSKWDDPVTQIMGKAETSFPYEANGIVECRPDRIEFLGS